MRCEECGTALYAAGDVVPPGDYLRVDDGTFRRVTLERAGRLPPSYDGHVARYRAAAAACRCERRPTVSAQRENETPEHIAQGARRTTR